LAHDGHACFDATFGGRYPSLALALISIMRETEHSGDAARMVFRVQQHGENWSVRLGSDTWGEYLVRRQAIKTAMLAAQDARRQGYHAMVWDASRRVWHC